MLQIDQFSNLEMIQNVCQLILDICNQFSREKGLKGRLASPIIQQMLNSLNSYGIPECNELAKQTFDSISNL